VFGPRPGRNYRQELPKQVKWLARRSAYNVRAQDGGVFIIAALELEVARTKAITGLLGTIGVPHGSGLNTLILTDGSKLNVHLSARNLPGVMVKPFGEESAYDLLWADVLVIEAPALERAQEVAHA
jgi:large subunit ribosomal protein L4